MNASCSSVIAVIEKEYLARLLFWSKSLTEESGAVIADEYEIFWFERKRRIETALLFLDNRPYSSYFMTASLYPDFSSGDQYSFLALGAYHILDTNLGPKIKGFSQVDAENKGYFLTAIKEGFDQEIDLLTHHEGLIWLLPLTQLFGFDGVALRDKANEFFLSFFPGVKSTAEFFLKMRTMEDVYQAIDPEKASFIAFASEDKKEEPLKEKWANYKNQIKGGLPPSLPEPVDFYGILCHSAQAALNAVFVAHCYRMVPVIWSVPVLRTFLLISSSYLEEKNLDIPLKTLISYQAFLLMDGRAFSSLNDSDFFALAIQYDLAKKVEARIPVSRNEGFASEGSIQNVLGQELSSFYQFAQSGLVQK